MAVGPWGNHGLGWAEPAPAAAKATSSSPAREVQAEGKEPKLLLQNDPEKSS